jgi:adenosylcobinamide-GDP ribazoletransferase
VVVGLVGALSYWLATLLWPSSIAVVLSMLATLWLTQGVHELGLGKLGFAKLGTKPMPERKTGDVGSGFGLLIMLLFLLLKFDALMALSAAKLPFSLPVNAGLGIIMIVAHAASRALLVSVLATQAFAPSRTNPPRLSAGALSFALVTGFLPATLLGLPGLIGLATAIVIRLVAGSRGVAPEATQQLAELGFYLGALGAWSYI